MDTTLKTLNAGALLRFQALQAEAVRAVTERFYATHGSVYEQFGPRGREACREDLAFHLEFLRPVLEFGLIQPMVDYLCWLNSVLVARSIPAKHLGQSLDWLAEFFAGHMDAAEGALVSATLQAVRTKFLEIGESPAAPPVSPEHWPETAAFEAALLEGNQREAMALVNRCIDDGHSLVEIELHVIQAALYGIGEKWQANQASVAQEHMATAIVQSIMTMALLRSQPPASIGKRVLLACVEGNNHGVGLRMVADAFQLAGWEVQYLGANVPTRALIGQVAAWKPNLVGLSVSFAQQLRVVKEVIAQLGAQNGVARPGVIIGGLAINRFNSLAGVVGADAYCADPRVALAYARETLKG
ncbi:MAG: cobalamin B12-binding domain-containing protein [Burkholderiales bacterium]|nr:cobalamin B12-binding domain-containing protein [Burkholderiales bacterium]